MTLQLQKHNHLIIFTKASCLPTTGFLVAQSVKNPLAVEENWDLSLGQENALEKEVAIHSSILARRIPWTDKPGRLQSMRSQESDIS